VDESEEILDLVDDNDHVIGTIARVEGDRLPVAINRNIRFASCFVQNSRGLLWTPRRTAHKKLAPRGLDFAAAEHVQSGETYLDAVIRGLSEELHMIIEPNELEEVGKLPPTHERAFFSMIYCLRRDSVPFYNPEDFTEYEWLKPEQLRQRLEAGEIAKEDLLPAVILLGFKG
jgi:isopentenyl-diphosphate delta-isomerase